MAYYNLLNLLGFASIYILIGVIILIYFPFIFSYMDDDKREWLKRLVGKSKDLPEKAREDLIEKADKSNRHLLYKATILYLSVSALIFGVYGLSLMVWDVIDQSRANALKTVIFFPFLAGIALFGYYQTRRDSAFFRELGSLGLFAGLFVTFAGMFSVYEIEAVRGEVQILIPLLLGVFLVYFYRSYLTAFLMMIVLIFVGSMYPLVIELTEQGQSVEGIPATFEIRHDILHMFFWIINLALVYVWIRDIMKMKLIGVKEWTFGFLLAISLLFTSLNCSGPFGLLTTGFVFMGLYLLSKRYVQGRSTWEVYYPLKMVTILAALYFGFELSVESSAERLSRSMSMDDLGGLEFLAFIFNGGLAVFIGKLYVDEFYQKREDKINLAIFLFTPVMLICLYISPILTYVVASGAILYITGSYVYHGVMNRNAIAISLGSFGLTTFVAQKVSNNPAFLIEDEPIMSLGLLMLITGGIIGGVVYYLNSKWNFDDIHDEGKPIKPMDHNDPNVLDSIEDVNDL